MNHRIKPLTVPKNYYGLRHLYDFAYETIDDGMDQAEASNWRGPMFLPLWANSEDEAKLKFGQVFRSVFGSSLNYRITEFCEREM